jgi:hypothetical protein
VPPASSRDACDGSAPLPASSDSGLARDSSRRYAAPGDCRDMSHRGACTDPLVPRLSAQRAGCG